MVHWLSVTFGWLIIVVIFLTISAVGSYLTGWADLAERFESTRSPSGPRFWFKWATVGSDRFDGSHMVNVSADREALYLSAPPPFNFMHPPLLIPWSQVEFVEEQSSLFSKRYKIAIRDHRTRFTLSGAAGRSVKEAYDSAKSLVAL